MSKVYFLCFVLNRTIELPSGINWEDACHNRNHNHYPRHGTKLTSLQIHIVLFLDHYSPHCKNNCGKRKTIICISGHQAIDLLTGYQTTRQLVDREMVRHYTNGAGQSRICGGKDLKASQAYPKGYLANQLPKESINGSHQGFGVKSRVTSVT